MKNLLFFASDFQIGLSSLLVDQLIALHKAGVNVTAVTGDGEQEKGLYDLLQKNDIQIIHIKGLDVHSNFKRLTRELSEIIIKNSIEVIHIQNNWQLALAGFLKNKHRFKRNLKVVYTLHGFRHNHPVKAAIAHVVIGCALWLLSDNVICMTEFLKKKFWFLSYKIKLIPLGIKESYFIDSYVKPPVGSLKVVFPAQFRKGKNQDLIIRAFYRYVTRSSDKNATLTLPGKGPLLENMKLLVKRLGIEKQIIFPGFVSKEEIKDMYLDSNVAIVASNSETFGQSIVEPYVLGRCVISTPVGIAPEIIEQGKSGFIFHNERELTEILNNIGGEEMVNIGLNNYNNRDMFSWENITENYITIIL